jgi:ubiquitin C-terminal hydrolase
VGGFDLSPYISPDAKKSSSNLESMYDLIGVSHHAGSAQGGHYFAHVDTTGEGNWACFNDDMVESIQAKEVRGSSAYMLFYKLRQKG